MEDTQEHHCLASLLLSRGRIWMKSQTTKLSITLRLQVYIAHPDVGFPLLFSSITLDG